MNRSDLDVGLLSDLQDVVGPEHLTVSEADLIAHSVDYSWVPRYLVHRGRRPVRPDFVAYPGAAEELAELVKIAASYKTPVTVWGGGSGVQGGALPARGGLVVDTKRLNRILDLNQAAYTVTAETGLIQHHLESELNKRRLSTMHLPASGFCATLGGFLARRGAGALSTKYGKMEDLVVDLEAVLPGGRIIRTSAAPRRGAGPDLTRLFIGSEGVYGVLTKVTLKIFDEPEARGFRAYRFAGLSGALEAGRRIVVRRLGPAVLRVYDEDETVRHMGQGPGTPGPGCGLIVGFDGYGEMVEIQQRLARELCLEAGGEDLGEEPGQWWWRNRGRLFYPPYVTDLPQGFGVIDAAASFDGLEALRREMKAAAESFPGVRFSARFTHWYPWGADLNGRFVIGEKDLPERPEDAVKLYAAVQAGCLAAADRRRGPDDGSSFEVLKALKKALDPDGLMNPAKLGL